MHTIALGAERRASRYAGLPRKGAARNAHAWFPALYGRPFVGPV